MEAREVTLTIPLTLTVRVGDGAPVSARSEGVAIGTAEQAARPRSYYQGYTGYDPNFLGADKTVRVPILSDEQRRNAAKNSDADAGDDPTLLPYTHFSVVMNRRRQLAYYTVVNIAGSQSTGMSRGGDRWFFDSRIAESE